MRAHAAAIATILVWGTTFVSTKVLLESYSPMAILLIRFAIGFLALAVMRPRMLKVRSRTDEALFAAAGLTGICAYYLLENIALTLATASIVGVTVSVAPLFTALVAWISGTECRPGPSFFAGFVVAMAGVILVSFPIGTEASDSAALSPDAMLGVGLALGAALVWGIYSTVVSRLAQRGYETIAMTKRTFAWGLVFMVIAAPFAGLGVDAARAITPVNVANLLFLGLLASAACFASWGYAVKGLGAARTTAYIYCVPAITVTASVLILGEPMTLQIAIGIAVTIGGLFLSESRPKKTEKPDG